VVRDRKSGFCLADHYGYAAARVRGFGAPFFRGNCGKGRPDLLWVQQGSSIGYTDRYPAHYHGQNVNVTGLAAGRYWLVHRANPNGRLRERTSANNAASVLVRLAWPKWAPCAAERASTAGLRGSERC
jgi:Lysyl oxidase